MICWYRASFSSISLRSFPGFILAPLKDGGGVLDELALPLAEHLWIQLILRGYLVERRLLPEEFQDHNGFKF